MDDVVRTHATLKGVPIPDVMTNVRTNKPDGGVDTQVRCAVPGDDTEFMDVAQNLPGNTRRNKVVISPKENAS